MATAAQAGEAHAHIRKRLRQWFGARRGGRCHVIYGGSVKPDNIRELIAEAGRRRGAGRRREPRGEELRRDRRAEPARCCIIGVSCSKKASVMVVTYYLVTALYVLVCLVLLLVILLQQGKGDMAAAFGGGSSQSAFGARAGATVLSKATAVLAALFMLGAMVLAIMGQRGPGSVVSGTPAPAPVTPAEARCDDDAESGAARRSTPAAAAPPTPPKYGRRSYAADDRVVPTCGSGGTGRRTSLRGWR